MFTLHRILFETRDPFRTDEEWSILDAIANKPSMAALLPIEHVSVKDLVKTQDVTGASIAASAPIIVLDRGDGMFVIDGHHRLRGAEERHASRIAAHVLLAPEPLTLATAAMALRVSQHDILNAMHPNDRMLYASVKD